MNDRLEFAIQRDAQSAADAMHARMRAVDANYSRSSNAGHTTAWAIPYEDKGAWCVNVKDRGRVAVEPADTGRLKPFSLRAVTIDAELTKP